MPLTRVTGNIVQEATLPESKLINPYVNISGDTMTGTLYLATNGLVAGTNQLVLSGGNVGIKNLSPAYALDVTGDIRASGTILTNSLLNVPAISLSSDGTSGSPAFYFGNENNTGIYRSTNGTVSISSSGNLAASISSSVFYNRSGSITFLRTGSFNSTDYTIEYSSGLDTLYIGRDVNTINVRTGNVQNRLVINSVGQVSVGTANTVAGVLLNVAGVINATGFTGINVTDLPTVTTVKGGTGVTTYSAGDILYYTSGTSLTKLTAPATRSILTINNNVPVWISAPLLPVLGGTGSVAVPSNGQILIGNGTSFVAANITANAGISITNGAGTLGIGVTGIPNSSLTNSSVTVTAGSGLAGGGSVSLGGSVTLTNAGVTGVTAGSGITLSSTTGSVLISNSGVRTAVAGSGITVSSSTGAVTFSLNSASSPTFAGLSLTNALGVTSGGTGLTTAPTSNQILYGNGLGGYAQLTVVGAGITITPDFNARTLTLVATPGGGFADKIVSGSTSLSIPVSNNDIIATVGGVEAFRVDTAQRIGIGTTSPSTKLDFGTGSTTTARLIGLVTNISTNSFTGIGLSPLSEIRVAGFPSSINPNRNLVDFGVYSNDGNYTWTSRFLISNTGNVGVGTTTPSYNFDVNGDVCTRNTIKYGSGSTSAILAETSASIVTTNTTSQVVIDTYNYSLFRSCKYFVQIRNTDNNLYQSSEIILTHDATVGIGTTNAYITEYAIVSSGSILGTFDADIASTNVRLLVTPTFSNNILKIFKTIITN